MDRLFLLEFSHWRDVQGTISVVDSMLHCMSSSDRLEELDDAEREQLAVRMRLARRRAGLDQREVGQAIGCASSTVSRLETGKGPVRRWMVRGLSDLYGVPYDWLAFGEGEAPTGPPPQQEETQPEPQAPEPGFVRQYLVCPVCGQDALTPQGLLDHLTSDRCDRAHTDAEAQKLAPQATVDPQPWAYVLARYERQLEAARQAARFRIRGRTHWRRLVRIVRTARDRMLEQGPDAFRIRNPRLDDPYWIPTDLDQPDWPGAIQNAVSDAELDELENERDRPEA